MIKQWWHCFKYLSTNFSSPSFDNQFLNSMKIEAKNKSKIRLILVSSSRNKRPLAIFFVHRGW